jgi:hypothetical protein
MLPRTKELAAVGNKKKVGTRMGGQQQQNRQETENRSRLI